MSFLPSNGKLAAAALGLAALLGSGSASATLVATISGQYLGDTPNLWIINSTGFDFTDVQLQGQAYNGSNALLPVGTDIDKSDNTGGTFHRTQIKNLANIGAGTTLHYVFSDGPAACGPGFSNEGDLFATDYDDTYGCTTAAAPGNVTFTFTAMWNGQPIFAVFSPDVNATGGFLGFLGLDEQGHAESFYDAGGAFSGTGENGVLAEIFVGRPPVLPEPGMLPLLALAAGLAARASRRR